MPTSLGKAKSIGDGEGWKDSGNDYRWVNEVPAKPGKDSGKDYRWVTKVAAKPGKDSGKDYRWVNYDDGKTFFK